MLIFALKYILTFIGYQQTVWGSSRYNLEDISNISKLSPEDKKKYISTLYEAIQLYQVSGFLGYIDNVRVLDENSVVMWVFHKPGYYAVKTNGGCCAASANWLSYILKDKYHEVGCFGFCQDDGNGHIINYIYHNNEYYFVDMMTQRQDQLPFIGTEDGNIDAYRKKPAQGYIYKANSFESFIQFYLKKINEKATVFYYTPNDCYAIGTKYYWKEFEGAWGLMPETPYKPVFYKDKVNILYSKSKDQYMISDTIAIEPNWALAPSFTER